MFPQVQSDQKTSFFFFSGKPTTSGQDRVALSQQVSRSHRGDYQRGGYVLGNIGVFGAKRITSQEQSYREVQQRQQPLVKKTIITQSFSSFVKPYDLKSSKDHNHQQPDVYIANSKETEPTSKDDTRLQYQGLSQQKQYFQQKEIQTDKFIFKPKIRKNASSYSEVSTDGSQTIFLTKISNRIQPTVMDSQLVNFGEKDKETYKKSIEVSDQTKIRLPTRKLRQSLTNEFTIKDPLLFTKEAKLSVRKNNEDLHKKHILEQQNQLQKDKLEDICDPLKKYLTSFKINMKKVLVINSLFLKTCTSTNSLQHLFMNIQTTNTNIAHSAQKGRLLFKEFQQALMNMLKINSPTLYFYLKDGTPIYSYMDIPQDQYTIVFSSNPVFRGISLLDTNQKDRLLAKVIHQLESRCKKHFGLEMQPLQNQDEHISSVEAQFDHKYKQKIDRIIDVLVTQDYEKTEDSKNPQKKYLMQYLPHMKRVALINQGYLTQPDNIQYIFMYIQAVRQDFKHTRSQTLQMFEEFSNALINKLGLKDKDIQIFLLNGTKIHSYEEIPNNQNILIYSETANFKGHNYHINGNHELIQKLEQIQTTTVQLFSINDDLQLLQSDLQLPQEEGQQAEGEEESEDQGDEQEKLDLLQEEGMKKVKISSNEDYLNSNQLQTMLHDLKKENRNQGMFKNELTLRVLRVIASLKLYIYYQTQSDSKHKKQELKRFVNSEQIVLNKREQQLTIMEEVYDKELKQIEFDKELEGDINQVQAKQLNDSHCEEKYQKQLDMASKHLNRLLDTFLQKLPKESQQNQDEINTSLDNLILVQNDNQEQTQEQQVNTNKLEGNKLLTEPQMEINFNQNEEEQKIENYIDRNKKKLTSHRQYISQLHSINKELFQQNMPQLLKKTNFTRYELHSTYILYCALQQVTSQRYRYYNLGDGIDYETFRNGIYQVFMQSEELARNIFSKIDFNFSGFLNWDEFLDLMVIIRAKTLNEKIDLFIKIADEDGNGLLSKDEIFKLSKICLSKYITLENKSNEEFLDMLCEYFTRLIFQAVDIDIEDEIPMHCIKNAILEGNQDSDLLCMFCGADM